MQKIWVKIIVVSLMTFGLVIPTAMTPSANAVVATRPNAISGTYTTYTFANAITGVTGNGSEVTFTFNSTLKTGTGSDWRAGDYITVDFPSSNTTTTAYNLGQVAITAITTSNPYTITVASTVKVDTAKYPNTVALTGLTSASTGIRAGTLTVTRDPSGGSTPNGCSLGGTMTIATGTNYDVPKYVSLGQAINNGSTVKIASGEESVDQGIFVSGNQITKTVNGTVVSTLASCKGTLYIPEGVKSLSSSGQSLVTNIAFPSTMEVIQGNALSGYTSLVSLNLDPVKYLMSSAFASGCNITSLSLGPTFEFFGKQALQGCANLTAVALPASIRSLGEWTFGGSAVTYFDLPASFTCTEPGLLQESGCDQKIGQYFFGGQSGQTTLAPSIKINLGNIVSASTKLALQHYLGVQTLKGTVTSVNDPNCTIANRCKTTTFVPNSSGNLLPDQFGRTGMGYNVGNFPSVVFTQNSAQGPEKTFTQSVTDGVTTQLSAVSTMSFSKTNNTFTSWNTAANGSGTTYLDTSSINITSTLTLYAQWSPIYTYTVNLNPGTGGTGTQMTAMTGTAATVKLNANTYSRTGYTFNGWNTAADGTGTAYTNQGTVLLTVDNQTVTLYAQWSIITYTITYLPGPNGASTSSAQTLNYGGSVTLKDASAGFTRTGYSITGWTTSSVSGAANTNDLGSAYSTLAAITLYPVWGAGVYAITYDGQGATTAASGGSTTYTAATAVLSIPTTAPLRSGYNFIGWYTAATGGTQVTNGSYTPSTPFGAITIYARWSAITNNAITYDGQGATAAASGGSTTYTTAAAVASIPTTAPLRTGYTFGGWYTASTGGTQVTNGSYTPSTPYGAITIYAQWNAITTNAITYNGQGATTAASGGSTTYTTAAAVASIPTTAPLRTGYNFSGWYTAATGGTQVTNGSYTPSTPFGAITIYAQWSAEVYALNFNYGSASSGSPLFGFVTTNISSSVSRGSYSYGDPALTLPTVGSMIKTGYSFAGWVLPSGSLLTSSTFTPTATVTLTTKWNIQSFSISYSRGSIGSDAVTGAVPASQSANYLSSITLASTDTSTTIAGQRYDFAGWTISGTRYPIGSPIQLGASNITATASWVPVYTVTFILSDGVCIGTACDDNPQTDQTTVVLPVAPTRAGYNFGAWKDQSENSYAASGALTVAATSYIMTATWIGIERSVTYINPNGVGIPTQANRIYQNTFVVGATPTRTGYDFGGWSDQNNANYQSGDIYSVGLTNVTLTATWIPLGIAVTFFNNDGTLRSNAQSLIADVSTPLTQNALTRAGYSFGGWNTSSNGGGTPYSDGQSITIVSALNLYAQWSAITSNAITYDGQGATTAASGGSTTYTTAAAVASIPTTAPLRTGYTFGGWYTAATGGTQITNGSYTPSTPYGAITLYAQWSPNTYTVTYNANATTSGTLPSSQTYTTGGTALNLASITLNISSPAGGIYLVDGVNNPVLNFVRGTRYVININAVGHPFFFQTSSLSYNALLVYTSGVTGSGTSVGTIIFDVPQDAPSSLTFVCQNHSNMGNTISIGSSQSLTRPGYTFTGWNTASNGSGTSYSRFQSGVALLTDITLFAQWSANTYAVSYNGNSATSGSAPTSQSYTSGGTTLTLAGNSGSLAKAGFFFAGWNAASNGSGSDYAAGATNQSFVTDLVLWAKWTTSPTKTVVFKANGGLGSDASQSTNLSTNLITNTFTRPGYVFSNWNSLADSSGTSYANAATYTFVSDLTLFATWTEKTARSLSFNTTTFAMRFGETLTVTSVLSIGTGSITYSAGASTACSVNPTSGLITITNGVGSCDVSATVMEDSTYRAVTTATPISITVSLGTPLTPTLGAITSVDGVLKVAFTQSDSVGNGISDYKYSIDGITFISLAGTTSPLSIPGLIPGTYTLKIIAVNAYGESIPTAPVIVVVVAGPTVTVTTPGGGGGGGGFVPSGPSASEIAAAQKAAVDKALADKAAADKLIAEKAAADKAVADKLAIEKTAAERAAADKLAAERAAADKLAAERAAADKLAADTSAAAAQFRSTCNLAEGSTTVTAKSSTMKIYSQVCFVPDLMKPLEKDLMAIKSVITQLKSKKISVITLSSFADEKSGVNFKSIAQTRADVVAAIIKKANPNLKITYRLFGSSTKKNSLSLGRVVITA